MMCFSPQLNEISPFDGATSANPLLNASKLLLFKNTSYGLSEINPWIAGNVR